MRKATPADPAVFCRSTQQSFLRLASTPALLKAYGAEGLTNRDALVALAALLALPQVCEREEPPGVFALWHRLATCDTASPKVWMDAYLAAFAIVSGLRMVTLDRDFRNFMAQGLDLNLINP
ncbi:MAG: TA system VapC family ribonuclease toxin [Pseudomonadota bacterium]